MLIIFALFVAMLTAIFAYNGWAKPQSPKHLIARVLSFTSFLVAMFASIEAGKGGTFLMMAQTFASLALFVKLQLESWEF